MGKKKTGNTFHNAIWYSEYQNNEMSNFMMYLLFSMQLPAREYAIYFYQEIQSYIKMTVLQLGTKLHKYKFMINLIKYKFWTSYNSKWICEKTLPQCPTLVTGLHGSF
jgi:hypothetical protein